MTEHHERMRWYRRADLMSVVIFATLCGAIWTMIKEPIRWSEASTKIELMEPRVKTVEKELVELRSIQTTQMTMIIRELDGIHRELKKR